MALILSQTYRAIRDALRWIATFLKYLLVVEAFLIAIYALERSFGFTLFGIPMARQYEMQWHIHATIFSLSLGFCYLEGAHVRIDVLTASASERTRAIIEVVGLLVLALPMLGVLLWFSADFALSAYAFGEGSDSPQGLPARWIIKGILFTGFLLLLIAVAAMLARCASVVLRKQAE